jgi:integrase
MTVSTAPPGSTKVCASCGRPRANQRAGWSAVVRDDVIIAFTCELCPRVEEPIKRVEARGRVAFRARVDTARFERGRPRKQTAATFDTLLDARQWVDEVRAAVASTGSYGDGIGTNTETVAGLCDRWIASRIDVREVTRLGYKNWIAPVRRHALAAMPVAQVGLSDVQQFVSWLAVEGARPRNGRDVGSALSANSMRSTRIALQQAFDLALNEGTIARNPVKLARWPKSRTLRGSDLQHWTADQLVKFREYADTDSLAPMWRLTLCGMTRADICGLRWSDLDMDEGVARISQGRVALDDGSSVIGDPKSAARTRAVPFESVWPGTLALLRRMKAKQASDRLAAGRAWRETGLILVNEIGDPLRPEVYSDRFRRACSSAGVPVIKLHSVRHSIALALHQAGISPNDAAAMLGHSLPVHIGTYVPHSNAAGIQAAASALGRVTHRAESAS